MEKTMPATVSELAQRDVRRATLTPEKLKGLAVTKSDVKKIFILILGQNDKNTLARIVTHAEFLAIPVYRIALWYELDEFNVNTDVL